MKERLTNAFFKFGADNTNLILKCVDNEIVTTALLSYLQLSPKGKFTYKQAANASLTLSEPLIYGDRGPRKYWRPPTKKGGQQ